MVGFDNADNWWEAVDNGVKTARAQVARPAPATRFRVVLVNSEFRALWAAQILSLIGDRLARVGLGWLVFARTGSALLTASVTAVMLLPYLAGPLLSGIADRRPRRGVLVACDLARAAVVAAMLIPGVPLIVLIVLIAIAAVFTPLFSSARVALLHMIFPGRAEFQAANALAQITFQISQVVGYAVGGAVVLLLGPRQALAADALTFLASAALVRAGISRRDKPRASSTAPATTFGRWRQDLAAGARLVFGDRWRRSLVCLGCLSAFFIAPEALAVPYAADRKAGAAGLALLLSAGPLGTAVGGVVLGGWTGLGRWMAAMAVLCGVPLMACALRPGSLFLVGLLWAASGLFAAYNVAAGTVFISSVPDAHRAQAFGLAQPLIQVAQGVGFLLAGVAADYFSPLIVIAVAGGMGSVLALQPMWTHMRLRTRSAPD
jgi:MFS family permease